MESRKKRKFSKNKDRDIISTARYKSVLLPSRVSAFPVFFAIWGLCPGIKKYFDKQDFLAKPGFSDLNFLDHLEKSRFVIFWGRMISKKREMPRPGTEATLICTEQC